MASSQSSGAPVCAAISVDTGAPIPFSLAARPVVVTVAGVEVEIPCPEWCMEPHTGRYAALSDVLHRGRMEALAAPEGDGFCEILASEVCQWGDGEPFLMLDAPGDGATAELGPDAGRAFLDQARAHLDQIERQLQTVAALRAAGLQPRPSGQPAPPAPAPKMPLPRREPGKSL
ncbi:hypothetical protein [Streptomyces sp. DH37]|uniref:DUF6907 domain-containing protein n=1 Tax=Streptomyces sp. DH37 TaxID=3040122 RepID=UPI0024430C2E|nr:hypothetical protein [Streptomyces sp. DH37]MDG9701691.1 hypothetical protein [Streptomyces sp. DH37]